MKKKNQITPVKRGGQTFNASSRKAQRQASESALSSSESERNQNPKAKRKAIRSEQEDNSPGSESNASSSQEEGGSSQISSQSQSQESQSGEKDSQECSEEEDQNQGQESSRNQNEPERQPRKRGRKRGRRRKPLTEDINGLESVRRIKPNQSYRPKHLSEPYFILKSLLLLEAHIKPVSLQSLESKYERVKRTPMGHFNYHKERLMINLYISIGEEGIRLLEKGKEFAITTIKKGEEEKEGKEMEQEGRKKRRGRMKKDSNVDQKRKPKTEKTKPTSSKYPKKLLTSSKHAEKIRLLINESSALLEQDLPLLTKRFEESKTRYRMTRIPTDIGFFWEIEEKVLDCFAILAHEDWSSLDAVKWAISEARYLNCGKIILVIERKKKKDNSISEERQKQRQLWQNLAMDARAAGLTVQIVKSSQQTGLFLQRVTSYLTKKVQQIAILGQGQPHYGPTESISSYLRVSKAYNLRRITIKILKKLQNFSLESLRRIASRLLTLGCMYNKLSHKGSNQERLDFLESFLKDHQPNPVANWMLVCFFFLDDYKEFRSNRKPEKGVNEMIVEESNKKRQNIILSTNPKPSPQSAFQKYSKTEKKPAPEPEPRRESPSKPPPSQRPLSSIIRESTKQKSKPVKDSPEYKSDASYVSAS